VQLKTSRHAAELRICTVLILPSPSLKYDPVIGQFESYRKLNLLTRPSGSLNLQQKVHLHYFTLQNHRLQFLSPLFY
jgi:hypothetical protein